MLDFRQNRIGRSKNAGKERRLLLRLALLLGLVLILFNWAREPNSWKWIDRLASPSEEVSTDDIDNRLDSVPRHNASEDTFVVAKAPERSPGTKLGSEVPSPTRQKNDEYFPGVSADMFKSIRDDSLSSQEEQVVTLPLLDILNRTDLDRLRRASIGPIAYAQLFRQPEQYRGRLVTVSGTVRRANPIELFPNEYGLKKYYQVWLFPADNPASPMVVYCLELPEGFPTGLKLAEEVEVTGFFLKRWAYVARDSFRSAPTLLAKAVEWRERPVGVREPSADSSWIPAVVALSAILAVVAAWAIFLRTRPSAMDLPGEPPDFDLLRRMDNNQPSRHDNTEDSP